MSPLWSRTRTEHGTWPAARAQLSPAPPTQPPCQLASPPHCVRSPLFRVPLLPYPTALGVQGGAACVAWEVEGLPLLLSSVQGKTADASPPSRGVLSSEMRRGSPLGS